MSETIQPADCPICGPFLDDVAAATTIYQLAHLERRLRNTKGIDEAQRDALMAALAEREGAILSAMGIKL